MKDDIAIKINHISKSFRVPHEKHNSLKDKAVHIFGPRNFTKSKVLDDISFEVKKGEFFGIVGKNGSGKSTLLKILANIYQPTSGSTEIIGSLAPFIELGVGFNPELTGRENVYLSGTILGLTKKKIESIYDDIVAFAEIEEFMDQKLKNYSSGMQVRLAFSIAVRAESDILLIDEVLAVGDAAFQAKCFDYFYQLQNSGKTIVFVTHDMASVRRFCNRAVLISNSRIVDIGAPNKIATEYDNLNQQITDDNTSKSNNHLTNTAGVRANILNNSGKQQLSYSTGDSINIKIDWPKNTKVKNIGVAIMKSSGELIYGSNTINMKKINIEKLKNCNFQIKLDIAPGRYYISYGLFGATQFEVISFIEKGPSLVIKDHDQLEWDGIIKLESKWHE